MKLYREVKDKGKATACAGVTTNDQSQLSLTWLEPIEVTEGDIEKIMEESLPPWRNEFHKDAFRQGCKAILSKLKGE